VSNQSDVELATEQALKRLAEQFRKERLLNAAIHEKAAELAGSDIHREFHLAMANEWQKLADNPP